MNGLIIRIKMDKLLKKMNSSFDNGKPISGEELSKLLSNRSNVHAIKALSQAGCIKLHYASGKIYQIVPGSNSALYRVERAELWFNRVLSFAAGIISTLIVQWLIRMLSAA